LQELRGAGDEERAIVGILPDADKLAERLDVTWGRAKNPVSHCWPQHNIGERYEALLVDRLQPPGDHVPERLLRSGLSEQMAREVWEGTKKYRYACVDQGRKLTAKSDPDGKGLRRGELLAALGWDLGLPRDQKVANATTLVRELRSSGKVGFCEKQFIKWVCECYQTNHAAEFSAQPNFCAYDPATDLITRPIFGDAGGSILDHRSDSLFCNAKCAPLDRMMAAPPGELIGLRNDFGIEFHTALRLWARDPSDPTKQEDVRKKLDSYCSQIVRRINAPPTTPLHLFAGKFSTADRKALGWAGASLITLAGVIAPKVTMVAAGVMCAYWLGRAVADRKPEDWLLEFRAGQHEDRTRQNEFTLDRV